MPAFNVLRPFTRKQALAAGITPMMLRGAGYRQLFRGIHISSRVPFHPVIRAQGALLTHPPGAFASHFSAARLHNLPVPDSPDEHVSVFKRSDRRRRDGITSHIATAVSYTHLTLPTILRV